MFITKKIGIVLLIIFSSFGCRKVPNIFSASNPRITVYQKTLKQWTREEKLYNELETILLVDALYKNQEVQTAYIEEYARTALLSPTDKEKMLENEMRLSREKARFLIAAYSGHDEWTKLYGKESIWTIILEDDQGNRVRPSEIREMRLEDFPLKDLYSFVTPWKKIYQIDFPLTNQLQKSQSVKLIMSSLMGKIELQFP